MLLADGRVLSTFRISPRLEIVSFKAAGHLLQLAQKGKTRRRSTEATINAYFIPAVDGVGLRAGLSIPAQ